MWDVVFDEKPEDENELLFEFVLSEVYGVQILMNQSGTLELKGIKSVEVVSAGVGLKMESCEQQTVIF